MVYLVPGKKVISPATHTQECLGKRHCTCKQSPNHTLECAVLQCTYPAEDKQALQCDIGTSLAAPAIAGLISLFIELPIIWHRNLTCCFHLRTIGEIKFKPDTLAKTIPGIANWKPMQVYLVLHVTNYLLNRTMTTDSTCSNPDPVSQAPHLGLQFYCFLSLIQTLPFKLHALL